VPVLPKILLAMRDSPRNVKYAQLLGVCEHYFGPARSSGSSQAVFRTPWASDSRVSIQHAHGKPKEYQVRQVLAAIRLMEESDGD
jgi:hypothetical protein